MSILSKWDDYFIHQTEQPLEIVAGNERERLDSCYIGIVGVKEKIVLSTGLRSYPNTRNMPAFAIAWKDGIQYNFRATRGINNDRAETTVGPLSINIIEPHRHWKFKLEENEYAPISYDLELEGLTEPYLARTTEETRKKWPDNFCHICQPCRYNGRLTVAGKEYPVKDWIGPRDRFWGVLTYPDPSFHIWTLAMFRDYHVFIFHHEKADGTVIFSDGAIMTEKENIPLTKIEHDFTCEPVTKKVRTARLEVTAADGTRLTLQATPMEMGIMFAGGPCTGDFSEYLGPLHFEGDSWNLKEDKNFTARAEDLSAWASEFECNNELSHGFFEYKISKDYQRY